MMIIIKLPQTYNRYDNNYVYDRWKILKDNIKDIAKIYLDLIYLADSGSIGSIPIYFKVLLIYLQVLQLASSLFWS